MASRTTPSRAKSKLRTRRQRCNLFQNESRDWALYNIWDVDQDQDSEDSDSLQDIFHGFCSTNRINMSPKAFEEQLQKTFARFCDKNLKYDIADPNFTMVVRLEKVNKKLEHREFTDIPLELEAREIKFHAKASRLTPTPEIGVLCSGLLAEILNGIISQNDVLIISGNFSILSDPTVTPVKFPNISKRSIVLNGGENPGHLQIIRIPVLNEDIQSPFLLIEKVKPNFGRQFSFRYLAWDPDTNITVENSKNKIFSVTLQKDDMRNPSREVYEVVNLSMPIHRYMSPYAVFSFLISTNKLPPIEESYTEEIIIDSGRDWLDDIFSCGSEDDDLIFKTYRCKVPNKRKSKTRFWSSLLICLLGLGAISFFVFNIPDKSPVRNFVFSRICKWHNHTNCDRFLQNSTKTTTTTSVTVWYDYDWSVVTVPLKVWAEWFWDLILYGIDSVTSAFSHFSPAQSTEDATMEEETIVEDKDIFNVSRSCVSMVLYEDHIWTLPDWLNPALIIDHIIKRLIGLLL